MTASPVPKLAIRAESATELPDATVPAFGLAWKPRTCRSGRTTLISGSVILAELLSSFISTTRLSSASATAFTVRVPGVARKLKETVFCSPPARPSTARLATALPSRKKST